MKSPSKVHLHLTASIAEVMGTTPTGKIVESFWYLAKQPLVASLPQWLDTHFPNVDVEIEISTNLALTLLRRRLGQPTPFITTGGFETWANLNLPVHQNLQTLRPQRTPSLLESDLIFGLGERVRADGSVEKELSEQEINYVVSKLQLGEHKAAAIGFLNSGRNPSNEQRLQQALTDKGILVYASHEMNSAHGEQPRWWTSIVDAYLYDALISVLSEVDSNLKARHHSTTLTVKCGNGEVKKLEDVRPTETFFGLQRRLTELCPSNNLVYFGFDEFFSISDAKLRATYQSEFGELIAHGPHSEPLVIQPTEILELSAWDIPSFTGTEIGHEPGPMMYGRNLKPCLLDLIFEAGRWPNPLRFPEVNYLPDEKRVTEALHTLSHDAVIDGTVGSDEVGSSLLAAAIEEISFDLNRFPKKADCFGALAPLMQKLLKERYKNLAIKSSTGSHLATKEAR